MTTDFHTYEYTFGMRGMGETSSGVIRMLNDINMGKEKLDRCMEEFNIINASVFPLKPGTKTIVPILPEYWDDRYSTDGK